MFDVAPGAVIEGFSVGTRIHSGAMGDMFEVTTEGTSFPLLMKIPRLGLADSAEVLLAFETEAMILPRLAGPHVPRFVKAGDVTTVPYIVIERVRGESLDRRAPGSLSAAEVARIGAAIADALHDLHDQGAVHHDLKPDNLIVGPDGRAVLLDFGLAYHLDLPDMLGEEQRHAAGSAPYVSPEQVQGVRGDPRSDLFALGVVLYEIATEGKLPFGVPSVTGWRDRLWRIPVPPSVHVPSMPQWLQEIVLRCLEIDPSRRYQSAAHVAFDLRHPEQVALTARAARKRVPGFGLQVRRWLQSRALGAEPEGPKAGAATVVLVAVDTVHLDDPRQENIQRVTRRILSASGEFRVICVSIVPAGPEYDMPGRDAQLEHRIRLRNWTEPIGVDPARLSLHVLEGADPAPALIEFAAANHVDLIVIGAPAPDERALAWWRSVASSVTANAPCSVHVVRRRVPREAPPTRT
jgi:eukaryotic-like serine/threonine-protein kinase